MTAPSDMIYQLLSTEGHGGGATSMVAAANTYKIIAPPDVELVLVRCNLYMEDGGQFRGDRYGATTALSNGIRIVVYDTDGTTELLDFTAGAPIKKIGHWGHLAGVDVFGTNYTTGNNTWIVRWTMAKSGKEVVLKPGQSFALITQDDLGAGGAALVEHTMQVQGYKNSLLS